ncbi:hypothetical protein LAWI1_G001562 [Lachnellula willkommii]|uniref:Uncharacterized protein n=1 Tax=Lachnellula willkommii TaxID=215461 RepID=A0A559MIF2_9HELO|nr:hypothetical protein LAWI1_G001562 [Lachnellula willkommii]
MRPSRTPSDRNSYTTGDFMSSRLDADPHVSRGESRRGPDLRPALSRPDEQRPRADLRASGNTYQAQPSVGMSQRLPLLDRTASQRLSSGRLPLLDRTNSQRLPLLDRMTSNRLPLLDRTRNLAPTDRSIRAYAHGESSERSDPGNESRMATRQTQYQQLPAQEQQEQEQWAQSRLSHNWKKCQAGFLWVRDVNGYRCTAGFHFVTDELVAEGKGYFFVGGGGLLAQNSLPSRGLLPVPTAGDEQESWDVPGHAARDEQENGTATTHGPTACDEQVFRNGPGWPTTATAHEPKI